MTIMIISGILLFVKLNEISDVRNAFQSEKKWLRLTIIFFCISFIIRIVCASCWIANTKILTSVDNEVISVQIELIITIVCD